MQDLDRARQLVFRAIDALNAQYPPDQKIGKAPTTVLFDKGGCLDSMGFVELAMQLQEVVLDECGVALAVAGDSELNGSDSAFRTVESLVDHLAKLLECAQAA